MSHGDIGERPSGGLFAGDARQPIPLEGVLIDARLEGVASEVTVAQRYRNREPVAVEAVYVFPLEEAAAVCGFEARIGETIIRGRVEEREKAFEIYDDAMADGHGAFLLDQERPNVFTASVGNLRPDEAVEIRITYVAVVRQEGASLRLMIPTTVSPRYVPPANEPEVGQPDGERVNPERWLSVPYGLELCVEVEAGGPVGVVESPSHPVRVKPRETGARVELSRERAALDRDFVLLIETPDPHHPSVRVAVDDDGTRYCQVAFYPELEGEQTGATEVIFLLDCSGSMIGDSIEEARRALALSIRALEEGDSFNVVRFGTRSESLWRRPRLFDDQTLEEATRYIQNLEADLGGTEIRAPLKEALELRRDSDRHRQILLLTDGEVANERDIVRMAEKSEDTVRIFTFGIGAGSSEYLVRELARVTGGAAEFIFPGERIEPKVLRTFRRVHAPALGDVELDWDGLEAEQAPSRTPPIFAGDSLTVFARIRERSSHQGHVALAAGEDSWQLELDLELAEPGGPIPRLWARERIRELERGIRRGSAQQRPAAERRRYRRLVELGRRHGLVSSATSYVAVEERSEDERLDSPAELRRIPIALTVGWGGHGRLTSFGPQPTLAGAPQPGFADAMMQAELYVAATAPEPRATAAASGLQKVSAALGDLFGRRRPSAGRSKPARRIYRRQADRLYALLMTQKADGSFRLSEELMRWLAEDLAAVERAAREHGEAVVATAVAVALFERDEAGREDEWRPAARKARKWLARQSTAFRVSAVLGNLS